MTETTATLPSPPTTPPAPGPAHADIGGVIRWLEGVRTRARWMLIAQQVALLLALSIGVVALLVMLDYTLRTPGWMRGLLWVLGAIGLSVLVRRRLWPSLRFAPTLTEIALRLERTEQGRQAGLSGLLAAGLDLNRSAAAELARLAGPELATPVIALAAARGTGLDAGTFLNPTRTRRRGILLASALTGVLVCTALLPRLTGIGARRTLWPFASVDWPKRTGIADATGVSVHALGTALPLRAALTKSPRRAEETRVAASVRLWVDGRAGPRRSALLTAQRQNIATPDGIEGTLFERLLEPASLTADLASAPPTTSPGLPGSGRDPALPDAALTPRLELEYAFSTEDDETPPVRVLLVDPPKVVRAGATITPPEYARSLPGVSASPGTLTNIDLGPGTDERATPSGILAGSVIELAIEFNKPLPGLDAGLPGAVAAAIGAEGAALLTPESGGVLIASPGERVWTLRWTLADSVRLAVRARDEHGITSPDDATFRLESLKDNPPTVTVTAPGEDRAVLATAVLELVGEARDDVALGWVALERQLARRTKGSEGTQAEAVGDRTEMLRTTPTPGAEPGTELGAGPPTAGASRTLIAARTLDLAEIELSPGDELWITALAQDAYEIDGVRHEPVRSSVRRVRIMSRDELIEQIWAELGAVRRTAIKLDQDQADLGVASAQPGESAARQAQRAQAGLTERIARQNEAIARLEQRAGENNLSDRSLGEVLEQARQGLARAGERSQEAGASLEESASRQSQESVPPEAGRDEREQAGRKQKDVRDELANIIDLLDQGQDTWAAKRSVERVLQQQKQLRERTAEAARQTTGKSNEQLSPEEREKLDTLAQEQRAAGEQLKDAVEKMLDREQKLRKNDPAAAQAMAQAARQAQREQTPQTMQQAAEQTKQNQTNSAQASQSKAIQSMEQMLKQLDQTAQNRDEVLRRFLASLLDSLKGLVRQQEQEIERLTAAEADGDLSGLDAGLARLHQNTLGVMDQAAEGPRETAGVVGIIGKAADAQAAGVVALRKRPADGTDAQKQEAESLDRLKEALEAAGKLDDGAKDRQQAQKRAELKARYEDALRQQLSIQDGTRGITGVEPSRRTRATARQLGGDQSALKDVLSKLREEFKELTEAKVFDYAHTRLDKAMGEAATTLGAGDATEGVARRQASAVGVLKGLITALDDGKKPNQPFRQMESSGGGGAGSGKQPLLPPGSELKLLRAMQQEAADLTRSAAENPGRDPDAVADAGALQGELSEQGKGLLKRMQEQAGGSGGPRMKPKVEAVPKPDKADNAGEPGEQEGGPR